MKQNIIGGISGLVLGVGCGSGSTALVLIGVGGLIWSAYELYKACKAQ